VNVPRLIASTCERSGIPRSGSGRNFRSPLTPLSVTPHHSAPAHAYSRFRICKAPLPLTRFSGLLRSIFRFRSRSAHMLTLPYRHAIDETSVPVTSQHNHLCLLPVDVDIDVFFVRLAGAPRRQTKASSPTCCRLAVVTSRPFYRS